MPSDLSFLGILLLAAAWHPPNKQNHLLSQYSVLPYLRALPCAGTLCCRAPGKTYFSKVLLKLRLWTKDLTEIQIPDTFGSLSSAKTIILWSTANIQSLKYEIHCYTEISALSRRPSGYKKGQRCPLVPTSASCLHEGEFSFFLSAPFGSSGSGWFLRNLPLIVLVVLCWSLKLCFLANTVKGRFPWGALWCPYSVFLAEMMWRRQIFPAGPALRLWSC